MDMEEALDAHMAAVAAMVRQDRRQIEAVAVLLADSFEAGGKLLVCGNGGSAADSQHFVAEFVNQMRFDRPPLPAIALTTDVSVLSSISNDHRYDDVFARQVLALGRPGDILVGFSTSGRSRNVLEALRIAVELGLTTVGFTGEAGAGSMGPLCSLLLAVPSDDTPRVQEAHEFAYHMIAEMVEGRLFVATNYGEPTEETE